MPAKRRDVTGKRFGGVVVTSFSHYDGHYTHWNVLCDTCRQEKTMYLHSYLTSENMWKMIEQTT